MRSGTTSGAAHPSRQAGEITAEAPSDRLPLYVRAGSIVPFGPDLEWSTEKPADPIELRIYRGADGEFTLYEDENDNYNYEKGIHATISFRWDDAKQLLTIGDRQGEFPGMLPSRTFRVVFVSENITVSAYTNSDSAPNQGARPY
jgi:alpha-D-xyloside xylohydrolase